MPASVTLTVLEGNLAGQQFVFADRTTCILGRAKDCSPRFAESAEPRTISRHHCRLDINPPSARIRDLGSRNGTFVNGTIIGQRPKDQSAEQGALLEFPERDLHDGDEIRLGKVLTLKVSVQVPVVCADCGVELPDTDQPTGSPTTGVSRCPACVVKARKLASLPPTIPPSCVCAQCGRDIPQESGANIRGDLVCAGCKADPLGIVNSLLHDAATGNRDLHAIAGYLVERELGRGGMGVVYLARHQRSGVQVALKLMLPDIALNPHNKQRFLREIEATQVLDHPNLVRLRDARCAHGVCFLTLEYCDGGSVEDLRKQRGGTLTLDEAVPLILQVLQGLTYAHTVELPAVATADGSRRAARGLVHRDLKPANIFLSHAQRRARIGDFGLAKAFDVAGLSGITTAGMCSGTPMFMPRQQALDFQFSAPAVDVWAAAASLYCLLTGQPPRHFANNRDPWWVILETQPVPIRDRLPAVPKRLARVIDEALIDEPELTFKTAADFERALQAAL